MERMNDDGQWIVLMGFIVAISLFFLAIVVSESTLVGQTTSESVLDFSKADIKDLNLKTKDLAIFNYPPIIGPDSVSTTSDYDNLTNDIEKLYGKKKGVIVTIDIMNLNPVNGTKNVTLHYNDGITSYDAYQLDYPTGV